MPKKNSNKSKKYNSLKSLTLIHKLKGKNSLASKHEMYGGSEIFTYEQNPYNNDPQHLQVDTRHIFSEQPSQTIRGGKKTKKNKLTKTKRHRKTKRVNFFF